MLLRIEFSELIVPNLVELEICYRREGIIRTYFKPTELGEYRL